MNERGKMKREFETEGISFGQLLVALGIAAGLVANVYFALKPILHK